MKKKILYGTILLTMFLVLFFIFTPKAFADTGWRQVDGKWYYYYSDYGYYIGRHQIDSDWYYFDEDGVMQTGWQDDAYTYYYENEKYVEHNWYYYGGDGKAYTGSKSIGGKWYYFDTYSGRMYMNRTALVDGKVYLYGSSGAWVTGNGWKSTSSESYTSWYYLENNACVTGWKQMGKTWYYFNTYNGRMADSPTWIPFEGNEEDVRLYCFAKSGAWIKNPGKWYKETESYEGITYTYWYYFGNTSYAKLGWQQVDGTWYYFEEYDGIMATRPTRIYEEDDETSTIYCFAKSGAWIKDPNGWYSYTDTWSDGETHTSWYYFDKGVAAQGFTTIKGVTYYFNEYNGSMATGMTYVSTGENGGYYFFDDNGAMVTNYWHRQVHTYYDSNGNKHESAYWAYFGEDGKQTNPTGWQQLSDGYWYYFDEYGNTYSNCVREIDGKIYFFDELGRMRSGGWVSNVEHWYINGESKDITIWYYLAANGEATVGWKQIKGTWYCFDEWGRMLADTTVEVSASNWAEPAPAWESEEDYEEHYAKVAIYGFSSSGAMLKNTWYEEKWSWIDSVTGEKHSGSNWYYFGGNGAAVKGWKDSGKKWYFFNVEGVMVADEIIRRSSADWTQPAPTLPEDATWEEYNASYDLYAFDKTGAMVSNGWYEYKWEWTDWDTEEVHSGSEWYYATASGKLAREQWVSSKGAWYFMDEDGRMLTNQTLWRSAADWKKPVEDWNSESGMTYEEWQKTYDIYVFDGNGAMVSNKWYKITRTYTDGETEEEFTESFWYYVDKNGHAYRGLQKVGNKYYFFDESWGEMRTNFSWFDEATHRNYVFGSDGEQLFDSWYEDRHWEYIGGVEVEVTIMMYVGADGDFVRGWKVIGEDTYYFDEGNHEMYTGIHEIEGVTYEFADDGKLIGEVTSEPIVEPEAVTVTETVPEEVVEEVVETTEPEVAEEVEETETEVVEDEVEEIESETEESVEVEETEAQEVVTEETEVVETVEE